jgi:hypothetical protein
MPIATIHLNTSRVDIGRLCNLHGWSVIKATKTTSGNVNWWIEKQSDKAEEDMLVMAAEFKRGEITNKNIR